MYKIRVCKDNDISNINHFITSVLFDEEPLVSANGPVILPPAEESLAAFVIPQGHSVLAEDDQGCVIGLCLNDPPPQPFPSIYSNAVEDIKFQKLFTYMEERSAVSEIAPEALEVRLMAVHPDWRQKGIATELLKLTETMARQSQFDWLKIYCTSHYSNKLMLKLGWKLIYSLSYEEYTNNFEPNIRPPTKPHTHCNIYIKSVEQTIE